MAAAKAAAVREQEVTVVVEMDVVAREMAKSGLMVAVVRAVGAKTLAEKAVAATVAATVVARKVGTRLRRRLHRRRRQVHHQDHHQDHRCVHHRVRHFHRHRRHPLRRRRRMLGRGAAAAAGGGVTIPRNLDDSPSSARFHTAKGLNRNLRVR